MGDLAKIIVLKETITKEDYDKLKNLEKICNEYDKTSLKLELDFKLNIHSSSEIIKESNEFMCFRDDVLVGYAGINCFGGGSAEINGMVHPDYRRKGVFKRLLNLIYAELKERGHKTALLLCDHASVCGIEFIKATGAEYSFSEYKMNLESEISKPKNIGISLRKAKKSDSLELSKMDAIFFDDAESGDVEIPEFKDQDNETTYIAEKDDKVIGKIRLDTNGETVGIYGFGVLPQFRGKGYGREILNLAIIKAGKEKPDCIYLEVACENKKALNLYKSCGFIEKSIMDYYLLKL